MKPIGSSLILAAFFLLELVAFASFGYWGYHAGAGKAFGVLLAAAVPLAVAVLWGMFLSPKASVAAFAYSARTALKFIVFALASAALFASGHHALGAALLASSVVLVSAVFLLNLHKA